MSRILEMTFYYVVMILLLIALFVFGQKVIASWIADAVSQTLEQSLKPVKVTL